METSIEDRRYIYMVCFLEEHGGGGGGAVATSKTSMVMKHLV